MTPGMKFLRRVLFLPVHDAEVREQLARETTRVLNVEKARFQEAQSRFTSQSREIRAMLDGLLGKLDD